MTFAVDSLPTIVANNRDMEFSNRLTPHTLHLLFFRRYSILHSLVILQQVDRPLEVTVNEGADKSITSTIMSNHTPNISDEV